MKHSLCIFFIFQRNPSGNLPHFAHPARLFLACRLTGPSFILSWVCALVLQMKQAGEEEAPGRQQVGGLDVAVRADHTLWLRPLLRVSSHQELWTPAWGRSAADATTCWQRRYFQKRREKWPPKCCGLKTHAGSYFFGFSGSFAPTRSGFRRTWLRADCFHTVGVFSLRNNPDDVKQMRRSAARRKNRRLNSDCGVKNW